MKSGFGRRVITPTVGCPMVGYAHRDAASGARSIHDDLSVSAVFVESGAERLVILGYDLLLLTCETVAEWKNRLKQEFGVLPRQVLMNTSHTHSGPNTCTWALGAFTRPPEPAYMEHVYEQTRAAVADAISAARPVTVHAAMTGAALPVSRRRLDNSGKAQWAPAPTVPMFYDVPVVAMKDESGALVAVVYSAACHPSTVNGFDITADYPGVSNRLIEQHAGRPCAVFLQGCAGDSKAAGIADGNGGQSWRAGNWQDVERAGQMLAAPVIEALGRLSGPINGGLSSALIDVNLPLTEPPSTEVLKVMAAKRDHPCHHLWAQRMLDQIQAGRPPARHATVTVQCMMLGREIRLLAIEGEPVAGIGTRLKSIFGGQMIFALGYSNGQGLYIPTEQMLAEAGYEVESAWEYGFAAPLASGFEQPLFDAVSTVSRDAQSRLGVA